ncbi:MAG: thioredoxin domain-containing protein [Rhodothermales bacterium]
MGTRHQQIKTVPNRLKNTLSPYLLQHAENPVAWYEWGEAAFEQAREQDKLIFLSVGYATCHWCHVMAHESFEDAEVAALLNADFVSIKLDREERPDIDAIYMEVCQLLTGRGGWPLTVILMPDGRPFFAGTYFPKQSRHGRIGMMDLLPRLVDAWQNRRGDVERGAEQVVEALQQPSVATTESLDAGVVHLAFQHFGERYDATYSGFGEAPKFPAPHTLVFLLHYGWATGHTEATDMAAHTLRAMREGGLFDHLGGGFHRYSTDVQWRLPHFEKMLYDQAMLLWAYAEAFGATRNPFFADVVREIAAYVQRVLTHPNGGFYVGEDADSEGEEGTFYIWRVAEIKALLEPEDATWLIDMAELEPGGNYLDEATRQPNGTNLLIPDADTSTNPDDLMRWERVKPILFAYREQREKPSLDDKVLADWNGLMIGTLARASVLLDDELLLEQALPAFEFVEAHLTSGDELLHRYRQGESGIDGLLDDYACMTFAALELHQATQHLGYLKQAINWQQVIDEQFWDATTGGYFMTPEGAETLIHRPKAFYDGAIPSGNAMAAYNLTRLWHLTGHAAYRDRVDRLAQAAGTNVHQHPSGFAALMMAILWQTAKPQEVVLVGECDAEWAAIKAVLDKTYHPFRVVLSKEGEEITYLAPFTEGYTAVDGQMSAYVCTNRTCERPVTTPSALRDVLARSLP